MPDLQKVSELVGDYRPTLVSSTVIAWIKAGKLKGVKVGKFWYVDRDDVNTLFAPKQFNPSSLVNLRGWTQA